LCGKGLTKVKKGLLTFGIIANTPVHTKNVHVKKHEAKSTLYMFTQCPVHVLMRPNVNTRIGKTFA